MIKILAVLAIMTGSFMLGMIFLEGIKKEIICLENFIRLLDVLKSNISFARETLAECCKNASDALKGELGNTLLSIYEGYVEGNEYDFVQVFENKMEDFFTEKDYEWKGKIINMFSAEDTRDTQYIVHKLCELKGELEEKKKILKDRVSYLQKPVLSLCLGAGALVVIFLL